MKYSILLVILVCVTCAKSMIEQREGRFRVQLQTNGMGNLVCSVHKYEWHVSGAQVYYSWGSCSSATSTTDLIKFYSCDLDMNNCIVQSLTDMCANLENIQQSQVNQICICHDQLISCHIVNDVDRLKAEEADIRRREGSESNTGAKVDFVTYIPIRVNEFNKGHLHFEKILRFTRFFRNAMEFHRASHILHVMICDLYDEFIKTLDIINGKAVTRNIKCNNHIPSNVIYNQLLEIYYIAKRYGEQPSRVLMQFMNIAILYTDMPELLKTENVYSPGYVVSTDCPSDIIPDSNSQDNYCRYLSESMSWNSANATHRKSCSSVYLDYVLARCRGNENMVLRVLSLYGSAAVCAKYKIANFLCDTPTSVDDVDNWLLKVAEFLTSTNIDCEPGIFLLERISSFLKNNSAYFLGCPRKGDDSDNLAVFVPLMRDSLRLLLSDVNSRIFDYVVKIYEEHRHIFKNTEELDVELYKTVLTPIYSSYSHMSRQISEKLINFLDRIFVNSALSVNNPNKNICSYCISLNDKLNENRDLVKCIGCRK